MTFVPLIQTWGRGMYPMHDMGNWGWFLHMLMPLTFLIILVTTVALLFWFIANQRRSGESYRGPSTSSSETPLDILKKRYARGEIDEDEYRRRKDELQ